MKKSIIRNISNKTLGILGGGQLGKMLALEASKLGIKTCIYDPDKKSPAFQNANIIINDEYNNKKSLKKFAQYSDLITYEFENIPLESLKYLNKFCKVYPGLKALRYSQDRYKEKKFISKLNITVAPFFKIDSFSDLKIALNKLNGSGIIKTRKLGYDGKGQYLIENFNISKFKKNIEINKYIIEGIIKFKKEISVIAFKGRSGDVKCYEPSENQHESGILRETNFPARISLKVKRKAKDVAKTLANSLNIVGIIAIEMFIDEKDNIIVNEIAPRPHNSGHWTMDACNISQFEILVRTIFDMPLHDIKYYHKCRMINIFGENYNIINNSISNKNHKVYIYGKDKIKKTRKLGHINILN